MSGGQSPVTAAQVSVSVVPKISTEKSRNAKLKVIFIGLASLSIIINLDGGAVPAALISIQDTFELSTTEVGLLGMLVYEGIGLGCLVVEEQGPLVGDAGRRLHGQHRHAFELKTRSRT